MNFVKQVEEQLRDLGTESRRKHPAVKEAAERAILSLRALQNKYVVAVRKASQNTASGQSSEHPTTALFQSQDVLRPFLLAANYPDVGNKVLNLSMDGIQTLIGGNAILRNDGVNVVRILHIQANVCAAAIQGKNGVGSGTIGSMIPSAGSVMNAGVGTISSLGNSILSGFGFKSERVAAGEDQQSSQNQASNDQIEESPSSQSDTSTDTHTTRSVASTSHASHRSGKEDEALSIRILQTVNMIVDSKGLELNEEVLSQCISICLVLSACGTRSNLSHDNQVHSSSHSSMASPKRINSKRKNLADKNHANHSVSGAANKVSGAAIATLRQIISTLFTRATEAVSVSTLKQSQAEGSESNTMPDEDEKTCLETLASKTLLDLCSLVKNNDIVCDGPFGQALIGQQSKLLRPSRTLSFNLIELILEQHKNLFEDEPPSQAKCNFHLIFKNTLCPLLSTMLKSCTKQEDISGDGPLDLMLKLNAITTSIISSYGTNDLFRSECFDLLASNIAPIIDATDLLRDSHEFEDGYVYDIDSPDETLDPDLVERSQVSKYESTKTMWAAAISIESLYTLLSTQFLRLLSLFKEKGRVEGDSILSIIISAVCDFTVVASSSKDSISQVVKCASTVPSDTRNIVSGDGEIFLNTFYFHTSRINPSLISSAKHMTNYNIGECIFTAFNFVLIFWQNAKAAINEGGTKEIQSLLEESFGPSIAVIQHFLRRCPASDLICQSSLSGLSNLASSLLPLCLDDDFKRGVICSSLSKLCLPARGNEEIRELRKLNHMSISLLLQLMQSNSNDIKDEWSTVILCLSELSGISTEGNIEDTKIADNISKLGKFSMKLNDASLNYLIKSIIDLCNAGGSRAGSGSRNQYGFKLYESTKAMITSTKLMTQSNDFHIIPFLNILLFNLTVSNASRFGSFGNDVMIFLSKEGAINEEALVRTFHIDAMSHLIASYLTSEKKHISHDDGERCIIKPLCSTIQTTTYVDSAEQALIKLKQVIEDGHDIMFAWQHMIMALTSIAECSPKECDGDWSGTCTIAFGCLKLLVDDFLNELPNQEPTRIALLDCCAAFGSSRFDINTSLTATGMLWSIADQDNSPDSVDHVLAKLAVLASDDRVEVRNCVVNTLFSCVVGLGQNFTAKQWEGIFTNTIFGVLDQVQEQGAATETNNNRKPSNDCDASNRYKVSVHHSRDSASKQWATTQVLTLRGIERVLRQFFEKLLATTKGESKWFDSAWNKILDQCYVCSCLTGGRDTLDLRLVGVELLVLCCQVSSATGFVATDVRVGTNMQVVNGALRSVRTTTSASPSSSPMKPSPNTMVEEEKDPFLVDKKRGLFSESFSTLMKFDSFLRSNEDVIRGGGSGYVDSIYLQVLTKLSLGLSHLYDSCKGKELSPYSTNDREEAFVNFIKMIATTASGGSKSKFLTQAQRPCLDLLKSMSLNCSSRAFEVLTHLGSAAIFSSDDDDENDILQIESGKLISEIWSHDEVKVDVKRTRTGLSAVVYLPGADLVDEDGLNDSESKSIQSSPSIVREIDANLVLSDTNIKEEEGVEEESPSTFEKKVVENESEDMDDVQNQEDQSFSSIEHQNAENAQLKEINAELMRQVEKLRSQKERLEQQVAVLSEGSAYI